MFQAGKTPERAEGGKGAVTVIARGVRVEGDFVSPGDVQIEGEVRGHVVASGALQVGTESVIIADVHAAEAVIAGQIQGNITIAERIDIRASARITGDIQAETMSIEAGAVLQGQVSIGQGFGQASARVAASGDPSA